MKNIKSDIEVSLSKNNVSYNPIVEVRDIPMSLAVETSLRTAECKNACKACPNYGVLWTCPPFDKQMPMHKRMALVATRIYLGGNNHNISEWESIFSPVRDCVHDVMLRYERLLKGQLYSFAGNCPFCNENRCSRIFGLPCRHPELARPSLEGVGFNVQSLTECFFNQTIEWGADGYLPSILTFMAGISYGD